MGDCGAESGSAGAAVNRRGARVCGVAVGYVVGTGAAVRGVAVRYAVGVGVVDISVGRK